VWQGRACDCLLLATNLLMHCIVHKQAGSFASAGICVCYFGTLVRVRYNVILCALVVIRLCGCHGVVRGLLGVELDHVIFWQGCDLKV
jgi:hypothetical protein